MNNVKFHEEDRKFAAAFAKEFSVGTQITIESLECEDDALQFDGYAVQLCASDEGVKYVVFVESHSYSYRDGPDIDVSELSVANSLVEAFKAIAAHSEALHFNNFLESQQGPEDFSYSFLEEAIGG